MKTPPPMFLPAISHPRPDQQVGSLTFQRAGDADKATHGQVLLAPLDQPDVIAVAIDRLGQPFLRHPGSLASHPDGAADFFAI